jgi:hypothetical protein
MVEPIRFWVIRGPNGIVKTGWGDVRVITDESSACKRFSESYEKVEMVELSAIQEQHRIEMDVLKARAEKMEKFILDLSGTRCGFGPDWADHEVLTHVRRVTEEALKP